MAKSHGLILDALDTLSRPGNAVKDLLNGNGTGALHQIGQIPLDLIDSILPTSWQPDDLVTKDDEISGRDLVGAPDTWWGHALGFGVDVATDPLTYFGGPIFKGIGKGAGAATELALQGADKVVPGAADAITGAASKAGRVVRDFAAQQRADHPELWNALDRISGSAPNAGRSGLEAAKKALGALDQRQRTIIADAIDNVRFGPDGKPVGELIPSGMDPTTGMPFGGLRERIAAHPDVKPEEVDALADAANQALEISRNEKARPGIFDAESQANLPDEYTQRQYNGLKEDPLQAMMGDNGPGLANALKERKNKDWRDILATLEANPGATYERDALTRLAKRSGVQSDLAKKADVGSAVWDLMRQGKIAVPEDTLLDELKRMRAGAAKPPVPESGAYEDVGAMLGGKPAEAAPAVAEEAESGLTDAMNEALVGDQTGQSVVGESSRQPSLAMSDFKPDEIEAATKSVLGKDFALSDPATKQIVRSAIAGLYENGAPETAKMALDAFNGIAPRNAFWQALANSNAFFKKWASYGLAIPKAGKIFRNRLNGPMQTFSNDATRGATLDMLKTIPSDLTGSLMDAIGKPGVDAASGTLEHWEDALAHSAGDESKAYDLMAQKYPVEAAFIKHGGMSGFVRADDLIKEAASPGWLQKLKTIADFPTRFSRGIEDRMRLQLGRAQTEKYMADGMSLEDAAKAAVKDTNDALYRYGANSKNSRMAKDLIPYLSWNTNAIPAEVKMMLKHPWYASLVEHAMHRDQGEAPIYPYQEEMATYDLGEDSTGNRQVVNGFGFPFESTVEVPSPFAPMGQLGRQIEKNWVGQSAPLIKTAYGLITGRDPNFETPFGTYDRVPLAGNIGEAGRLYNVAQGTGLMSPVDTPLRLLDQMLDDRRDIGTKALGLLTGANISTVDPLRAQAQQLQEELDRNPDVSSIAHLTSKDEDAKALIDELNATQRAMKARRKKAVAP